MATYASLKEKIFDQIKNNGPLPVSRYMELCLTDPEFGYYQNNLPIGFDKDFITSPELGFLFSRTLAQWVLEQWNLLGKPTSFSLCEFGGGTGALMAELYSNLGTICPDVLNHARLYMFEINSAFKKLHVHNISVPITYCTNLEQLPDYPIIAIANEFFDALPINQYVWIHQNFYERRVYFKNNQLTFGITPNLFTPPLDLTHFFLCPEGSLFEYSQERMFFFNKIIYHLEKKSGAALLIDYGSLELGFGDTLQALSRHTYQNIFANPGKDDLTSHVSFFMFLQTLKQTNLHYQTWNQKEFLLTYNLKDLVEQTISSLAFEPDKIKIMKEYFRLVDPKFMGSLFKVLAMSTPIRAQ